MCACGLQCREKSCLCSPFLDVSASLQAFVDHVEEELQYQLPQPPPVSVFASESSIPCLRSTESSELFNEAFVRFGRVSHLFQILAMHPTYASKFSDCMHTVMYGSGPLPRPWRAYIAAMAGAAARCPYIVRRQFEAFLADGGDETWIEGIDAAPVKLQRLCELNNLLMVRPWAISEATIASMAEGTGGDAMSAGEIVHAIIILTAYHSISALVWGMGVQPEIDMLIGPQSADDIKLQLVPVSISENPTSATPRTMLSDTKGFDLGIPGKDTEAEQEELMNELLKASGADLEDLKATASQASSSDEPAAAVAVSVVLTDKPTRNQNIPGALSTAGYSALFQEVVSYRDFSIKEGVLRTRDFSWSEHGYPLLNRYFAVATTQVDDMFTHTFGLTYRTLGGHANLDTTPYRTAVWYMVHRLFGITNDDYHYSDINRFLKVPTKRYIKRLVTTPWLLRQADFQGIVGGMTDREKCHINLLALEAKKQASIMYALSAVARHFA